MNVFLKRIIIAFCGSLLVFFVNAQVSFTASITPAQINKDQYATLRLEVHNSSDIKNIQPPSLSGFVVISGPNQESSMSSMNGKVDQSIAVSFVLQARKPGRINIGAATAVIGNNTYKSNALTLIVQNKTSGNAAAGNQPTSPFAGVMDPFEEDRSSADFNDYILHKGEDIPAKVAKNMQLRLQTDKTSCYVGEPIIASYKLYSRLKSESQLDKSPSFNGFSVIDLQQPDVNGYAREKLDGREYNVYTIRKAQLYPLQYGDITLESATVDNHIQFVKEEAARQGNIGDMLNGFGTDPNDIITQSVSLSSKPIVINVQPLPDEGKPASFKGAVGDFKIVGGLAKNNFSTDETGMLAVKISGAGNLQLVTAPDIKWPDGIDPFQPKLTDNTVNTTVPVSGNKIFQFSFAVQKPGDYTLAPLEFSFFDPKTATYKTVSTQAMPFKVTKGTGIHTEPNVPVEKKEEVSFLNSIFSHRLAMIIVIAFMIAVSVFFWMRKEEKKEKEMKPIVKEDVADKEMEAVLVTSTENQQNSLQESEACLYREDCREFYIFLNKEMKAYLAHKFSLNAAEINSKTIAIAMDKANMDNSLVLQLQQLLQEIEWQVYTPFEEIDTRNEMYSRSHALIQLINTYHI
ncbi:MAG: BatD family protein [Ferruginibacter sp.]